MKVKEILKELSRCNENAEFGVVVNSYQKDFEICFGGTEGCTRENCDCVNLMVDTVAENI